MNTLLRICTVVLFTFGLNQLYANPILDSLTNKLAKIESKKGNEFSREKARLASEIADWYNRVYTDQDYSRTYLLKSIEYIEEIDVLEGQDLLFQSDVYRRLALYELQLGNVIESDKYMASCEHILTASKIKVGATEYTKALFDFHHSYFAMNFRMGKYQEAMTSINQAYELLVNNDYLAVNEVNLISEKAMLHSQMGDHQNAQKYAQQALVLYDENPLADQPRDRFIYYYLRALFHARDFQKFINVFSKYRDYQDYDSMDNYLNLNESMVTRTFFENVFMAGISYYEMYLTTENKHYLDTSYQRFIDGFRLGEKLTIKHDGDKIGNIILRPKNKIAQLLKVVESNPGLFDQQHKKMAEVIRVIDAYQSSRLHLERISHQLNAANWIKEKEIKNEITYLSTKLGELDQLHDQEKSIDSITQVIQTRTVEANRLKALTKRAQLMEQYKTTRDQFENQLNSYLINQDKTLLTYFYDEVDSMVFIIARGPEETIIKGIKTTEPFISLIDKSYTLNANLQLNPDVIAEQNQLNQQLYELLIAPVKNSITTKNLIIYPLNELSYISFDALRSKEGRYLIEDYSIQYTSSVFSIIKSSATRNYESDLMAFYPSNYGNDSLAILTNAKDEVFEIGKIFNGTIAMDELSTKRTFMENSGKHKMIHLATHSILNFEHPYESYIVFDATETPDSNQLYAFEIFAQTMAAEMVVLSSCNSARGEIKEGVGVLSLANAFYFAGVPSTVSSLWSAQDQSAADIMLTFYDAIKSGAQKSIALQKAKLAYLKTADQIHKQPFFWANYVVYGDDSALFESDSISSENRWWAYLIGSILAGFLIWGLVKLGYRNSSSKA